MWSPPSFKPRSGDGGYLRRSSPVAAAQLTCRWPSSSMGLRPPLHSLATSWPRIGERCRIVAAQPPPACHSERSEESRSAVVRDPSVANALSGQHHPPPMIRWQGVVIWRSLRSRSARGTYTTRHPRLTGSLSTTCRRRCSAQTLQRSCSHPATRLRVAW